MSFRKFLGMMDMFPCRKLGSRGYLTLRRLLASLRGATASLRGGTTKQSLDYVMGLCHSERSRRICTGPNVDASTSLSMT